VGEIAPFLVPIIVPTTLFVSVAAVLILRGPLGKAISERVAGGRIDAETSAETEALHSDVEELRYRLSEVEERLDFTERLLAQQAGPDALRKENC
jgi:hypothetical protein